MRNIEFLRRVGMWNSSMLCMVVGIAIRNAFIPRDGSSEGAWGWGGFSLK